MARIQFTVRLNGTDTNPFNRFGLTQNPFPDLAKYEHMAGIRQVQKLAGPPIPNTDYIREVLKGCSQEFIELCCSRFVKGEMVTFDVYFEG